MAEKKKEPQAKAEPAPKSVKAASATDEQNDRWHSASTAEASAHDGIAHGGQMARLTHYRALKELDDAEAEMPKPEEVQA